MSSANKWNRRDKPVQASWTAWATNYFKANPFKCVSVGLTLVGVAQLVAYCISIGFLPDIDLKSVPTYLLVISAFGIITAFGIAILLVGPGMLTESPLATEVMFENKNNITRELLLPRSAPAMCYLLGTLGWAVLFIGWDDWQLATLISITGAFAVFLAEYGARKNFKDASKIILVPAKRVDATIAKQFRFAMASICYGFIGFAQLSVIIFVFFSVERNAATLILFSFWIVIAATLSFATYLSRRGGDSPRVALTFFGVVALAIIIFCPGTATKTSLQKLGLGGLEHVSLRVTKEGCNLVNSYAESTDLCKWNGKHEIGEIADAEVLLALGSTYYISLTADPKKLAPLERATEKLPVPRVRIRIPAEHVRTIGRPIR